MKMAEEFKGYKHSTQVWSAMFILIGTRDRKKTTLQEYQYYIMFNHAFSAKWLKNVFCDIRTKNPNMVCVHVLQGYFNLEKL